MWIALLCVVLAVLVWHGGSTLARAFLVSGRAPTAAPPTWPVFASHEERDWGVLQRRAGAPSVGAGSLTTIYRLAGTFFASGEGIDTRKAVLHDLRDGMQHIVGEDGALGDARVERVFRDHVILRDGNGTEVELWLGFSQYGRSGEGTAPGGPALNAYGGAQVGENSWVYNREALLDYYRELMDDPERLLTVFDSLEPLYGDGNRITGYQLNVQGEPQFFEAVGLRQGDVVRRVNSLPMTSKTRAVHLIGTFVENNANAFVFEIDRGGESRKLVYQVR